MTNFWGDAYASPLKFFKLNFLSENEKVQICKNQLFIMMTQGKFWPISYVSMVTLKLGFFGKPSGSYHFLGDAYASPTGLHMLSGCDTKML